MYPTIVPAIADIAIDPCKYFQFLGPSFLTHELFEPIELDRLESTPPLVLEPNKAFIAQMTETPL